jgi:glycyl-tRNA synthetase alpha chain
MTVQETIQRLTGFWSAQGCVIGVSYDVEKGAGTMNPLTFFRVLGPDPWRTAYVEPGRRPVDARYGENPNRLYQHYQFQVVLKPAPDDVVELYLQSLEALGLKRREHDVRFVEDNWESRNIGAAGMGWEVWLDGMEVTQFTYFQQMAGYECRPPAVELTYGLERLTSYLANAEDIWSMEWAPGVTYAELFRRAEWEHGVYTFREADPALLTEEFAIREREAERLLGATLVLPAYEQMLKASHTFNHLDARGAISPTERQTYLDRLRRLAHRVASTYLARLSPEEVASDAS